MKVLKYPPAHEIEELGNNPILSLKKTKNEAIAEITTAYPEDSFCFLNEKKLRERISLLKNSFLPTNEYAKIAYAVKANPRKEILEILNDEGVDCFDCASQEEIRKVLTLDSDAKILFNHPIKTSKDIRYAFFNEVRHYTVQTRKEIQKILKELHFLEPRRPVEMAVRLQTLNDGAKVNLSTKFGAILSDAKEMIQSIKENKNLVPSLSIHTGSQNTKMQSFEKAIELMASLAQEQGGIKTLNVGGGLPVNYFESDDFDLSVFLQYISHAIEKNLPDNLADDPEIIIELGRSIIAEAIDLVIPVLSVEKRNGQKCVYFNDGVFTSFSDAAVHDWEYNFKTIGKDGRRLSEEKERMTLFGRTCDSGDVVGSVNLPVNLAEGDFVHVENAGAYMDSQLSFFNGFGPPKYVLYN